MRKAIGIFFVLAVCATIAATKSAGKMPNGSRPTALSCEERCSDKPDSCLEMCNCMKNCNGNKWACKKQCKPEYGVDDKPAVSCEERCSGKPDSCLDVCNCMKDCK